MSYRLRLLLSFLGFAFVSVALFYLGTGYWLKDLLLEMITADLDEQVQILAPLVDASDPELDQMIDRVATSDSLRITVVDRHGRVLADSMFSGESLAEMDNHGARQEIVQAQSEGIGRSLRYSTSAGRYFHYVAVPLPGGEGTLRIARPATDVGEVTGDLQRILGSTALFLLLVSVVASWLLSRRMSTSVSKLFEFSRRIADGETVSKIPLTSGDELEDLARQMERMSAKLGEQLNLLASERNHLNTILNSMTEGVLVTDAQARIMVVNPALREILGLVVDPYGKATPEVIRNVEVSEGVQDILESGGKQELEFGIGNRTLLARFAPIGGSDQVVGVVVVFHNISELRRLENLQKEFVSNVSHELKTPLTSIQGYAETLLAEEELSPVYQGFAEKIFRNSSQLSQMIEELFNLARLESGQPNIDWQPIRYAELMERLAGEFAEQLDAKNLWFRCANKAGRDTFQAGVRYVERVFSNLIENAIKYTESGEIKVVMDLVDDEFMFCVRDTGIGIPEEELESVFRRFYRVDKDRSRQTGGSGIGLAIVKHMVQLHGGRVWAESAVGKGSSFYFTIPWRSDS